MSDPVTALKGQSYDGFGKIREIGPLGMISLRCDLADRALPAALKPFGVKVPAPRRIQEVEGHAVAWMSPDELLLIVPYDRVQEALGALQKSLAKIHFLAVDVSDARAVFRIEGPKAGQVIAKICPVDLNGLAAQELRRTRAAQVPAALWKDDKGFTLICFRSVATYVMDLLAHSARPGSEIS